MIRKSVIVKKEEVFDLLLDPFVSRIEIKRNGNNNRGDNSIIRVYIYKNIVEKTLNNFKANLRSIVKKKNEENSWVSQENRDYLTGLVSAKFLKETCIERLKLIEIEEGINLAIPHALDN